MTWVTRPLRAEDAFSAARIHEEGQPDTFLTNLGRPFLCALYRLMATAPQCEGYIAEQDGEVVGVIVGTADTRALFRQLIWHSGRQLLPSVLRAILRHPSLLAKVLQTVRYSEHVGAGPGEAEVLFIGVAREWRRQGIGHSLLWTLADAYKTQGIRALGLTVDESNETAKRFYRRNGMRPIHAFRMYGRAMAWYRLPLDALANQGGKAS